MNVLIQTALLVAVTGLACGISVLARDFRNKLFLVFSFLCFLICAWALGFFLEKIFENGEFYRIHLLCNVWLGPAGLAFIGEFVRIKDQMSRRFFRLSLMMAVVLNLLLLFQFEKFYLVKQIIYFSPGFIVLQTLHLMIIDRRFRRGLIRRAKIPTVGLGPGRRSLIYLGALLVSGSSVMDHLPILGEVLPSIGNIALSVYLFFISKAILQQRLLNFGMLLSRFLVLIVLALLLTGIYSLLFSWIPDNPRLFFLNSFLVSFLLVVLLDPLRAAVRYFTQRLMTQKHRKLEEELLRAQRRLTGIVDQDALFHDVMITLEKTIHPDGVAVFILKRDETKFKRMHLMGVAAQELRELLADHPLLQHCKYLKRRGELPILLDQVLAGEVERSASKTQREKLSALIQGLRALKANLLIPFFDEGKILGFVTFYTLAPPEPWENNWGFLHVIYPYFEQVAQTLRNMEVYVKQREKERLAALGEMAAGLAHEIRNPLGAIKGAAQFLDPSADRPESRFLTIIIEEVDRLNRVVSQFLDYSKPKEVEFVQVDLVDITRKTVELLKSNLQPEIRLELDIPDSPRKIMGAPVQIQQLLMNLIQNGMQAASKNQETGKEAGVVRVTVEKEQGNSGQAVVAIEDNGSGIKKENMNKLFIPFFTTSPSGTGLGLSICQKIMETHRGRIEVSSEEGVFTRFTVFFPNA